VVLLLLDWCVTICGLACAGEKATPQPLKLLLTTKRIHDPDLIPFLLESDINFGAVKVIPSITLYLIKYISPHSKSAAHAMYMHCTQTLGDFDAENYTRI